MHTILVYTVYIFIQQVKQRTFVDTSSNQ